MSNSEFVARVAALFDHFVWEVFVLRTFLSHLPELVSSKLPVWQKISEQLERAAAGSPSIEDAADDEKRITLTLTTDQFEMVRKMAHQNTKAVASYETLTRRMAYIYLVALYDAYFVDLTLLILTTKPETLRSSKQITYAQVLESHTRGDLVLYIAQREVNELSYKSVREQVNYYRDKFNIELKDDLVEELSLIRAQRNLLVHTGGTITEAFIAAFPETGRLAGDSLIISDEEWQDAHESLEVAALLLRQAVIRKFAPGDVIEDDPYREFYGPLSGESLSEDEA